MKTKTRKRSTTRPDFAQNALRVVEQSVGGRLVEPVIVAQDEKTGAVLNIFTTAHLQAAHDGTPIRIERVDWAAGQAALSELDALVRKTEQAPLA